MSEETQPDASTAETGDKDAPVTDTPVTAKDALAKAAAEIAKEDEEPSYIRTARVWLEKGTPLERCAVWLVAQDDPNIPDVEAAKAVILAK